MLLLLFQKGINRFSHILGIGFGFIKIITILCNILLDNYPPNGMLSQLLHILLDTKYNTPPCLSPTGYLTVISVNSYYATYLVTAFSPLSSNTRTIRRLLVEIHYSVIWLEKLRYHPHSSSPFWPRCILSDFSVTFVDSSGYTKQSTTVIIRLLYPPACIGRFPYG